MPGIDSESESSSDEVNEIERNRASNIARNTAVLESLGLGPRLDKKKERRKRTTKQGSMTSAQGIRKSERHMADSENASEDTATPATKKPRSTNVGLEVRHPELKTSNFMYLSPVSLGSSSSAAASSSSSRSSSSSSSSSSSTTSVFSMSSSKTSPSSSETSATSTPSYSFEALEPMSLETYTDAVTRGVQHRFSSASEFYEQTSQGKQILIAMKDEVHNAHTDYLHCCNAKMSPWRQQKALQCLVAEQEFTHFQNPDKVCLFYQQFVDLPNDEKEKFLFTELMLESRRLARLRQGALIDLLSLSVQSVRQMSPQGPAVVEKMFADSEEKEPIQLSLKFEIYKDPLFFTKGESYVMRTIAMFSSWGTSLTINEKVKQLELYPDNAFNILKKWGKSQLDHLKFAMKHCFFGNGGQRTPDYRNKQGKNVFHDPAKVTLLVELFFQSTTGFDPTDENRVKDLRCLVESLVKFMSFHRNILDARPNRVKCDAIFWEIFHLRTHDEHVEYLESKGLTIFGLAFGLHVMLAGVGLYVAKHDADVILHNTAQFKGSRAIQEIVLLLLIAGQDNDRSHYTKQANGWVHAIEGGLAHRVSRVPGVDISQLNSKNQDALRYVNPILIHVREDERPVRCKALTSKGAFKDKPFPTDFLFAPAFLDGWPTPLPEEEKYEKTVGRDHKRHYHNTAEAEEEDGDESNQTEIDTSLA